MLISHSKYSRDQFPTILTWTNDFEFVLQQTLVQTFTLYRLNIYTNFWIKKMRKYEIFRHFIVLFLDSGRFSHPKYWKLFDFILMKEMVVKNTFSINSIDFQYFRRMAHLNLKIEWQSISKSIYTLCMCEIDPRHDYSSQRSFDCCTVLLD